jgi:hypothetical protein
MMARVLYAESGYVVIVAESRSTGRLESFRSANVDSALSACAFIGPARERWPLSGWRMDAWYVPPFEIVEGREGEPRLPAVRLETS